MKFNLTGKYLGLGTLIFAGAVLTGCGENPLAKYDEDKRVVLLCEANLYAEKESGDKDFFGSGFYDYCLVGRKPEKFCKKYYKDMAKYLSKKIGRTSVSDVLDTSISTPLVQKASDLAARYKCKFS